MVNIKGTAKFSFSYIAFLTGIAITLAGSFILLMPIWATPFFMAALPIAVIRSLLPLCSAIIGAKSMIFATFNNMLSHLNRLATPATSKPSLPCFGLTFAAAKSNFVMPVTIGGYLKVLAADFTSNLHPVLLAASGTGIRAKAILAASFLAAKGLAARFANWIRQLNAQAITGRRTKALAGPMRLKFLVADYTFLHS